MGHAVAPVLLVEHRLRRGGVVRSVAPVEALLVGLGEVEDGEGLAEAPRRIGLARLGVEPPQELVALHAVRVTLQDLRLRLDGLLEVLRDVARVELREELGALPALGIERLGSLVGVDRELRLVQHLAIELSQLVEHLDDLGPVLCLLGLLELRLEQMLDAVVVALLAPQFDRLVHRLRQRWIELDRARIEGQRLVDLPELT